MYSSPDTQVGADRPFPSRMCQLWFAIGLPYGMLTRWASSGATGWQIDQMDASVAPPRLITWAFGATARIRPGRPTGIQSPLSSTVRSEGNVRPPASASSTKSCMMAGTEFQTVTPWVSTASTQAGGSGSPGAGSTRVAPARTAPKMSYTERSKQSEEMPNSTSSAVTWKRRLISSMVLSGPWWSSIAPLGRPVEPEVKMTYARSCGPRSGESAVTPARGSAGPSTAVTGASVSLAIRSCPARSVSTTEAVVSASTARSRSSGQAGSSGAYAAPAVSTPSTAATCSQPLGSATATRSPGRAPWARSRAAIRSAAYPSSP